MRERIEDLGRIQVLLQQARALPFWNDEGMDDKYNGLFDLLCEALLIAEGRDELTDCTRQHYDM